MSAQEDSGLPFGISDEQQHLRLLELPPSLLETITLRNLQNLELKSAVPQTSTNSTQTAANAVLCTDNQTYQVRQVQSSNSVFVLQPSESIQASTNDSISVTSISAIAQCAVTLELVPASPSPAAYLKQTIPAYLGSESLSASRSAEAIGIDAIIRNMPFSSGECNIAWKELCGFELEGQALLPSASALVHIWESISSAAALSGACLSGSFSLDTIGRPVQEDGHAHDLFRAVIDRLCSENVGIEDGRGFLSCSSVINAERTEDVVLDRHLAISWVGSTLLESLDVSGKGSQVSEFINKWQNLLPEAWRKCVSLGLLKGKYSQPSKDKITYDVGGTEAGTLEDKTTTNASTKNARKWHEKFKNARR